MMKRLLLLLVLVTMGTIVYAQTALSGKVTEEGTGAVAELATVRIFKGGVLVTGAQTDFDGAYNISSIDPGTYTVEVTYVGFNPQKIEGVVIKAGKANTLNIQLSKGIDIKEVVITEYKVPLIEQDNTTQGNVITSEQIKNLPQKNINAIVGGTAGVSTSGENGAVTIRGSRSTSTVYYLDGVPVSGSFVPTWDLEQLQVITGGLGAEYGDVTGGVISGSTKGPSSQFGGGLEGETSQFLDPYGYNLLNANFSGPIIKNKTTNESILGYRISGSYTGYKDDSPSAVGIYTATPEAVAKAAADPITKLGPGFYVPTGELFTNKNGDVTLSKIRPNEANQNYDFTGRLDYKVTRNVDISVSGTYHYDHSRFSPGNTWWLLNSANNPESVNDRYRINFRFRHRLGKAYSEDNTDEGKDQVSPFRNASYTLQFFYQNGTGNSYDINHKDRFFDYGNVGKFYYDYTASLQPIRDNFGQIIGVEHVDNTRNFRGYDPSTSKNPGLSAYNKLITDANNSDAYFQRNGESFDALNSLWGFHTNINQIYNSYSKNQTDRKTFQGTMSFDFLPNGSKSGRHNIQVGLFYEERVARSYSVAPYELWKLGRLLQNVQILGVDTSKPTGVKLPFVIGAGDTIYVDSLALMINPNQEGKFYKKIREKLGIGLDHFVEIDAMDPAFFDLSMFSSRELTDARLLGYYGYDYLGNPLSTKVKFNDFFTAKDINGERTYPVAPDHPIYGAAYIQDKFTFKDIIFRLGLRADFYDANTKVLKDKFSLYDIQTAKEFYDNNPSLKRPAAVQDDYKVYVEDKGSSKVKAYRSGEQWYYDTGNKANDGNVIFGGQIVNPALKDKDVNIQSPNYDPNTSFVDYKPQINLMPRLAFSFPISEEANFFAHYDILVQRPSSNTLVTALNYFYYNESGRTPTNNPDLKPEKTIDYEVGFQQKISNSSALKISSYYKEMRNMIQSRTLLYLPSPVNSIETYDNVDFGTVKGFSIAYDMRRTGNVQLGVNYTIQFADGTGSDADSQRGLSKNGNIRTLFPLNFDERHVINVNLDYRYGRGKKYNGPRVNGVNILSDMGINIDARAISGRPYSKKLIATTRGGDGFIGALNGARLPFRYFLNLKIDKDIQLVKSENSKRNYAVNIYFRVENVLNIKTITSVYPVTGDPDDTGYLVSAQGQSNINNIIQSGKDVNAFLDSYQWYELNPDNYAPPRRMYIGATFQF